MKFPYQIKSSERTPFSPCELYTVEVPTYHIL